MSLRLVLLWSVVLAACGDNELPAFNSNDEDPYFHWQDQTNVGAYGLDKREPEELELILRRIDYLEDEVLVLYGHTGTGGVTPETIEAVLARAADAGVDSVTFADLAAGGPVRAGVAITFDDRDIDNWFAMRDLFARYDARATFFVTQYDEWTDEGRDKLHTLFDEGHSIEAHGLHHYFICAYVEAFGLDSYVNDEVLPSIEILKADGFTPTAYAFPGGAMGNEIVERVAPYIPITRGITQLPE
jgi:hypothetical protein